MKSAIAILFLSGLMLCAGGEKNKKLIAATFEFRNARTSHLARNVEKLETLPFDGIVINSLKLLYNHWIIGSTREWSFEEFKPEVEDMQKIASGRLKNNFLLTIWTPPKRIPFSDEQAWKRIEHNAKIVAKVAKEGKCAGVVFDVEDYRGSDQFYYYPEDAGTIEEAAQLARKRGRQVIEAMGKEFPEIKILTYHFFCAISREASTGDLKQTANATRNLWGYFINGMFEGLPPTAKLIEGNEIGYYMQSNRADFSYAALDSVRTNGRFILTENRNKFLTHGEFAFGLYMDAYLKKSGSFMKETLDGSKVKRFRTDLAEAIRLTDEYVWLYAENHSFLPDGWDILAQKAVFSGKYPDRNSYDQLLPGVCEAMRLAKNPLQYSMIQLSDKNKPLKNLLPNPKCNLDPKGQRVAPPPWLIEGGFLKGPELIPGWYFWPHWDAKPEKRYADVKYGFDDSFSLVGKDLKAGAFVADLSVKEGNFYAVEAYMQGSGSAFIKVKFSDAKRNWLFPHAGLRDVCIYPEMDEKNGWKKAFGVVCAPAGATYMTILLYMKQRKGEYNRFDNAAVYEIQPLTGEK